ncbi:hypothetical protein CEXT_495311 [Caerostris extrusa]|uniref:Uncharacterized protein n=1 Tax=Caerostris extrusa TaxID=172846 RepID=A0AAV4PIZ8_CAEEX|nr:hypothetical protein CEXT_495311 [Caerostris extrusa]
MDDDSKNHSTISVTFYSSLKSINLATVNHVSVNEHLFTHLRKASDFLELPPLLLEGCLEDGGALVIGFSADASGRYRKQVLSNKQITRWSRLASAYVGGGGDHCLLLKLN